MPRIRLRRAYLVRAVEPWLCLSLAMLLICFVMPVPLLIGISYSVWSINLLMHFKSGYVRIETFAALGETSKFRVAMVNTFWWTFGSVALQFGLGPALLLSRPFHGKCIVQSLVFLPWAVPTFLIALSWSWLLNPVIGPLPHWWVAMGYLASPTASSAIPIPRSGGQSRPTSATAWRSSRSRCPSSAR